MADKPIYGDLAEVNWCVLDAKTNRLTCQRCGQTEEAPMGLLIIQFVDIVDGFIRRHVRCQP